MKYTQKQIDKYRAKWLAQLRSPEAEQWTGKLENYEKPNKRCCLGHACHVLKAKRSQVNSLHEVIYGDGNDANSAVLPHSVAEKLNITTDGELFNCYVHGNDVYGALTIINDSGVFSLSEIANIIEEGFKEGNFYPYDGQNNE